MTKAVALTAAWSLLLAFCAPVWGQESPMVVEEPATPAGGDVQDTEDAEEKVDQFTEEIDRSEEAQKVSAGILRPVYALAEAFSFPAFHWLAFSVMVAGVVSFALQLVLGKLVVLIKRGFSFTEILSDALGLAVSLVGLVLTTQAAAENSTFTSSAFAVISATGVGGLVGFVFYLWGQRLELQALEGRRTAALRDRGDHHPPAAT